MFQAGQATEPEILIALTLMAGGDFQVNLCLFNYVMTYKYNDIETL